MTRYSVGNEATYQPHRAVVVREDEQTTLFMPSTTPDGVACKIIGVPPPNQDQDKSSTKRILQGVLTICDRYGRPEGVCNAGALTAFRTALGAMVLFVQRKTTANVVVFGAGKQALWHVRLAMVLRGKDIKRVTVVNRSKERALAMLETLANDDRSKWDGKGEGVKIEALDGSRPDFQEVLESLLNEADVVFCTTPAKQPWFPARYLTEKQWKGRYVSAIGSYKVDMKELDPAIFQFVVQSKDGWDPQHDQKKGGGGVIVVDTREGCFHEAGEIVQGKIQESEVVEVGEIVNVQETSADQGGEKMKQWLESGFVVYKSVGMGIMDLAVGSALCQMAKEKGVGLSVEDF